MDEQQRKTEETARNFGEALIASYRMSSRGDLAPYQTDPELAQRFCSVMIDYFDTRAAQAFAARQGLEETRSEEVRADRPEQESVGAYMDFLGELIAYYKGSDSVTAHYPWSEGAVARR